MSEANEDDNGPENFISTSPKFDFSDPKTFHDRVLLVEDKKFYVQSGLLMVWSEYFKGLFGTNFKEAHAEEIEIKDVSAEDFNNFLMLAYHTQFKVDENNYPGLINLAHYFIAPRVLEKCQKFLVQNIITIDKITLLTVAFKNDMVKLKDLLANYIAGDIINTYGEICITCHFPVGKKPYCIHGNGSTNYVFKWIYDNIDRISELPSETQAFILRSSHWKF